LIDVFADMDEDGEKSFEVERSYVIDSKGGEGREESAVGKSGAKSKVGGAGKRSVAKKAVALKEAAKSAIGKDKKVSKKKSVKGSVGMNEGKAKASSKSAKKVVKRKKS
jgi:hypothetical protein